MWKMSKSFIDEPSTHSSPMMRRRSTLIALMKCCRRARIHKLIFILTELVNYSSITLIYHRVLLATQQKISGIKVRCKLEEEINLYAGLQSSHHIVPYVCSGSVHRWLRGALNGGSERGAYGWVRMITDQTDTEHRVERIMMTINNVIHAAISFARVSLSRFVFPFSKASQSLFHNRWALTCSKHIDMLKYAGDSGVQTWRDI